MKKVLTQESPERLEVLVQPKIYKKRKKNPPAPPRTLNPPDSYVTKMKFRNNKAERGFSG
jgi:hypothetical protein